MTDSDRRPSLDDYLAQATRDGSFDAMLVARSVIEIHRSGKYRTIFVPEISSPAPTRTVNAVQMAAFFPNGEIGLLESFPGGPTPEEEETLRRILFQQTDVFEDIETIDRPQIEDAVSRLKQQDLRVAGAFQLGTLENGMRSVEVIYPLPFLEITRSPQLAATLSASFIRAVTS